MKCRPGEPHNGEIKVKAGSHVALLYSEVKQLGPALAFLAEGVERGEICACLSYARFNERLAAQLRDLHSVDVRQAVSAGTLTLLDGDESVRRMRGELARLFARAEKENRPSRLVTSLGWGEAGWPDELELMQLEVQLNSLCEEHRSAVLCLYDARQLAGSLILHGCLECHPTLCCRNVLHKNPLFVQPEALMREVGARKRDESRLRAWMS